MRRMMKRVTTALKTSGKPCEKANKSKKYQTAAVMPLKAPFREFADGNNVIKICVNSTVTK
jgi:hypothetical protein